MRSNGAEVAVKVQRPTARTSIVRDLYMLRIIGGAFNDLAMRRLEGHSFTATPCHIVPNLAAMRH